MAGMIQGIDGGLLINALRQGREDRYTQDQRELAAARQQAEQERQQRVQSLTRQAVGGGQAPEGVMGQYQAGAGVASAFGQAPGAAPVAKPDPRAMQELLVLDPEQYGRLQTSFKQLDEAALKKAQSKNDAMGSAAMYLQKIPPQNRQAAMQRIAPQLLQAGWTQEEIAAAEVSDEALMGYRAFGVDYDKAVDNELAERKFMAGDNVAMVPGGGVANVRPTFGASGAFTGNVAETVIAPNVGDQPVGAPAAPPAPSGDIARPKTKAERDALKPGTPYYDPNGVLRTVPGGASSNAGGGFRPVSDGASVVRNVFPNARVTSGYRSPDHPLSKKNPESFHTRTRAAADIAPIPGMTFGQAKAKLEAAGYYVHPDSRDEVNNPSSHATGPHWHFVIGAR